MTEGDTGRIVTALYVIIVSLGATWNDVAM
jgi:hypothetical protein